MQNVSFSKSALQVKTQIINSFSQVTPEANDGINSLLDINGNQNIATIEALIILNRLKDLPNNNKTSMLFFNTKVLGLDEINYVKEQLNPENIKKICENLKSSAPLPLKYLQNDKQKQIKEGQGTNDYNDLISWYNITGTITAENYKDIDAPIILKLDRDYSDAPRYKDLELLCFLTIMKEPSLAAYKENLIRDPKNATNTIIHFLNDFQLKHNCNQGYAITLSPVKALEINGLEPHHCICVHADTIEKLEKYIFENKNVSFSKSALQVKTQIINSFSQVTPEANKAIDSLLDINKDQQVTTLEALIILNRLKDLPNNNTKFMLFFNTKILGLDEINYVKEQLRPENIQTTINNLKKSAPTPANISTASKTNMLPVLYNMYNPKKNENRELHEIENTPITLKMGKNYSNAPRYKDLELLCLLIIRKEPSFTTYEENLIRDPKHATNTIIHFLNDFQLSRGYNQGYFIPLTPPIPTKIQGLSDATCNQICVHNDTITGLEALLLEEHIEQTKKLK